jgi:hypothetical protein
MNKYTIVNKNNKAMMVFAETEQRAIDIAMDKRHAYKEENLTISHLMKAPDEYHEGVASYRLPLQTSSQLMDMIMGISPETGDESKMGWYGGAEQQPKVGDPEWDRE